MKTVTQLLENIKKIKERLPVESRFLKKKWEDADPDLSGELTTQEIMLAIQKMSVSQSRLEIENMFSEVDRDKNKSLNFNEFVEFMASISKRSELENMWICLLRGRPLLNSNGTLKMSMKLSDQEEELKESVSIEKFQEFWRTIQDGGEDLTQDDIVDAIGCVKGLKEFEIREDLEVDLAVFRHILSSSHNDAYAPLMRVEYQDMTQPLSDYFISSSHNTYLEGDQLTSASSVYRYIHVLMHGCRCVEIDVWDDRSGEPMVLHGHTLTSKILFRDVIRVIYEHAFMTSPYPVIISLENHCTEKFQEKMVEILKTELGESLAIPEELDADEVLPSPVDLRHKILIKGTKLSQPGLDIEPESAKYQDEG